MDAEGINSYIWEYNNPLKVVCDTNQAGHSGCIITLF